MRRHSVKVGAAIAVAVIVVAGIWVAGGAITNDFSLAMWLTAAWIALAGIGALAVALRLRELAVPVIGTYLVTVAAAGLYLGRSMFLDDVVNEDVATAAQPRSVLLAGGLFEPLAHDAVGVASAIRLADGDRVLTLTGFEVDNGPDLRVYLVAGPARSESEVEDVEDLGPLKGNRGDQQYELPEGLDLGRHSTVVIWCRAFSVAFARAPLERS